jgi:hypothetical protein
MNRFQSQLLIGDRLLSELARRDGWDVPRAPSPARVSIEEFERDMRKPKKK